MCPIEGGPLILMGLEIHLSIHSLIHSLNTSFLHPICPAWSDFGDNVLPSRCPRSTHPIGYPPG